jgi:uncharacterized membrane protein (UPF0127 family)
MRLLVVLFFLLSPVAALAQEEPERLPLTVTAADGREHVFQVEIADTPDERARGLMHRQELADDHGMLFVYPRSERIAMWMRNTPIPLDMLFIDRTGRVTQVHERAVPFSEATIASRRRVKYVLEVPGGTAERLGLEPGDQVGGPAFSD